ncbi:MAG: hypothetical protein PHI27_03365 [Eubacteriales bacterium]|nr:hypothetical protein [Eubacteriales bacterium]MDD3881275.1 hypothetical protein [Eubacteriales bacterium]MDD4512193.1 hypothetical protein [Eubacteriales bacterium]
MRFFSKKYYDTLFGIGLLLCVLTAVNRQFDFLPDFAGGFFAGLGIVLVLFCGALKHNVRFIKKLEVSKTDEREQQITSRAAETALYSMVALGALAIAVLGFFSEPFRFAALGMAALIGAACLAFALAKAWFSRRM